MMQTFTTWTRRRGGLTINRPAAKDVHQFEAETPLLAAEMHMVQAEEADEVAVQPLTSTRIFARRARREATRLGHVYVIYAEEIPSVLAKGAR